MRNKILNHLIKYPLRLLITSILLSEIITILIAFPLSYFLSHHVCESVYIAVSCGLIVSIIVCGLLIWINIKFEKIQKIKTETEYNILQSRLDQALKMEAIGTLAGGIAHDFNNILSAILGFTELAKMHALPNTRQDENLKEVIAASSRASSLVKQILSFSRQNDNTSLVELQLSTQIKEIIKFLKVTLPTTIKIKQNIIECQSLVMADPTQIHQIITNLCTNAFHAMEYVGGELTIELQKVIKDKEYMEISIKDTGCGIIPSILPKIFNPYFTTKPVGKGTGMGLAIVDKIIKSYNGLITVESKINKGTAFKLYIPICGGLLKKENIKDYEVIRGHGEHILCVDDDPCILLFLKQSLVALGYTVTVCESAIIALDLFKKDPTLYNLIITDQTMPDLTGVSFAKEIHKIDPNYPIVLCTGFSSVISEEAALDLGIKAYLMKPISLYLLSKVIRQYIKD